MPMITVCPRYPDFHLLLHKLLKMYPEYVEEKKLLDVWSKAILKIQLYNDITKQREEAYGADTFFDNCTKVEENTDAEECRFLRLLSGMVDFQDPYGQFYYHLEEAQLFNYVFEMVSNRRNLTMESLKEHTESYYSKTFEEMAIPTSGDWYRHSQLLLLYSYFFPIFADKEKQELDVLRPISTYDIDSPLWRLTANDLPSLISYLSLTRWNPEWAIQASSDELNVTLNDVLFDLVARYLGAEPAEVPGILYELSYHKIFEPSSLATNPCQQLLTERSNIFDVCHLDLDKKNSACSLHCDRVVRNVTLHQWVKELLQEAVPKMNEEPGYPGTMLPLCQYYFEPNISTPEECWKTVKTDQGVCYSSRTGCNSI